MASFNTLNPNWDNSKIKEMFNLSDEVLNGKRFYYITSEGKLAYIEERVMNTAETIAKVFYTLGLLNSERTAKEQIACGIVCSAKHLNELQEHSFKEEEKRVLRDDIDDLVGQVNELLEEIKDKMETLDDLM